MTTEKLKQLAEFAAEFLEWYYREDSCYGKRYIHPPNNFIPALKLVNASGAVNVKESLSNIFFESEIAPILMHLGKREMEKRGFSIRCEYRLNYQRVFIKRDNLEMDWQLSPVYVEDENEFIAFWSAIEATGEK